MGRILSDVKEAVETQVRAGEDIKREQDLNSSEEAASDLVKAIDGNDTSTKPADDDGNVVGGDDELDFVDKLDQV